MDQPNAALVKLLNTAISAEYGALFLLPQHIAIVQDEETKRQLRLIADMELEHAEKTAQLIFSLGAEPTVNLPLFKIGMNLPEIIEISINGEQQAIAIYTEAAIRCPDAEMRKTLDGMKHDEEGHLRLLERIKERL